MNDDESLNTENPPSAWDCYNSGISLQFNCAPFSLGPLGSWDIRNDPKHLCFVLSRYKFCAKMLDTKGSVLEIGCGDSVGTPITAQHVKHVHCVDWDIRHIEDNRNRLGSYGNISYEHLDINKTPCLQNFDAAYMIDVIEHLEPPLEDNFINNICKSLNSNGILIVGTPNITSQQYASEVSKEQHINLHDHASLRNLLNRFFYNTFLMSMNDEVIHTGYAPMAHYIWGIGVGVRSEAVPVSSL